MKKHYWKKEKEKSYCFRKREGKNLVEKKKNQVKQKSNPSEKKKKT